MTKINRTNDATDKKVAGGRSPTKQSPGHMHDDDMKHKRKSGDVERDMPEQDEGGSRRDGGHSQPEMDEEETGGRSRPGPGKSRNM